MHFLNFIIHIFSACLYSISLLISTDWWLAWYRLLVKTETSRTHIIGLVIVRREAFWIKIFVEYIKIGFNRIMTLSSGNIFRVTGPLYGKFTGHRWIPLTKASDVASLMLYLICAWTIGWANNREAGDLRRYRTHYDVDGIENSRISLGDISAKYINYCFLHCPERHWVEGAFHYNLWVNHVAFHVITASAYGLAPSVLRQSVGALLAMKSTVISV